MSNLKLHFRIILCMPDSSEKDTVVQSPIKSKESLVSLKNETDLKALYMAI